MKAVVSATVVVQALSLSQGFVGHLRSVGKCQYSPKICAQRYVPKMSTVAMPTSSIQIPTPKLTKLLIDGKWVDSSSGKTFTSIDPRTELPICEVAEANHIDVDLAVKAAHKAFEGPWSKMSGRQRGRILWKLADLMEENFDELAMLETLDNGKPLSFSKAADVPLSIDHFRYFAGWADKIHGKTIPVDGNLFCYTLHEPVGVVGQIIPWNFPMLMQAWKWAPALAAGCTLVLKTAEQTPLSALRVAELAHEAGIPPGVINVISGFGESAGKPLAMHPLVDKIAFTGHVDTGRLIMQYAGLSNLKRVTLELGGKSPVIVCADADVDLAVEVAHSALFINHGQCCCAGSRLYVHEDIHKEFVDKMVKKVSQMKVGDPFTNVDQGPQVSKEQFDQIMRYIDSGKTQGATCAVGGSRVGDRGFYIAPTVFTDVVDEMTIAKEEIFGPVMQILKWRDLSDVIRKANDNAYGLAAGVLSTNPDTIQTLSRSLRVGTVWVNSYNNFDAAVPFGGFKMSGNGREKGQYALEAYTEVKTVSQPMSNPRWL